MPTKKPRRPHAPYVTVDVTAEMIHQGKVKDSAYCMISEAVKAAYPDARMVSTDIQTIRFSDPKKGLRFIYLTPRVAQVALFNFDGFQRQGVGDPRQAQLAVKVTF